ncbi:MAG: cell division protein FtsL [Alphaproteobacteria bacterium]|nr:cell division protein FtsL [Alphaproteobacteria bacterium]
MIKLVNAILVIAVLGAGFFMYSLEHATRGLERQVVKLKSGINDERETIKLLDAEWASLTRPDRLQKMAEEQLKLQPAKATQIVTVADIAAKIPDAPVIKLDSKTVDPIGVVLEKLP